VVPAETAAVRAVAERFVAGESLRSLANWLEAGGITTVSGGPWRTPTLRAQRAEAGIDAVPEP
jgi:hypothetical protein